MHSTLSLPASIFRLLTHPHALDALHALSVLEETGSQTTLTELALAFCRTQRATARRGPCITLAELFERYASGLTPDQVRYRAGLRWVGDFLCNELGRNRPVESISASEIEELLSRYTRPTSYNSIAARIRVVFRWGAREGLLPDSPVARLPLKRVPWSEPAYFPPEKVAAIFRAAQSATEHPFTPYAGMILTLGFFCGVRTAEIARARAADFDLAGQLLRVPRPKGFTSGMRPRLVELEPNASQWLSWWAAQLPKTAPGEPLIPEFWRFTLWKKAILEPMGLSWGNDVAHNVMRHTYATMHVGAFRNPSATALNLGHSHNSDMLEKHYMGLVHQALAQTYWTITPESAFQTF